MKKLSISQIILASVLGMLVPVFSEITAVYPTDIIPELTKWKITLPVDENGDDSSEEKKVEDRNTSAMEVYSKDLIDYEYPPYFIAKDDAVVFRAHCAGATTGGSKYPRSELRQLVNGGSNYWSMNDDQYLQTTLKVTAVPKEKPEVCMTQIHGPDDEPLRVQYHKDDGVFIIWNESNKDTKNALAYALGEMLRITVTVHNGDITCLIENLDRNEEYTKTWESMDDTGYFKLGCYTQSSIFLSQFKDGKNDESSDAYGEVAVFSISLEKETTTIKLNLPENNYKGPALSNFSQGDGTMILRSVMGKLSESNQTRIPAGVYFPEYTGENQPQKK